MYCKMCGASLDENSIYCSRCGADLRNTVTPEAEKRINRKAKKSGKYAKKKKNKLALLIIPLLILVGMAIYLSVNSAGVSYNGTGEANFNNGAFFSYDDNACYYVGWYNDSDEQTSVYSITHKEHKKVLIADNPNIIRIRVSSGKIFFAESLDNGYQIGMMNLDGSNTTVIKLLQDLPQKFDTYKGKLLYLLNNDLWSCDLEGKNEKVLIKNVNTFTLHGDVVYYSSKNTIYSYNLKKNSISEICNSAADSIVIKEQTIFFANENGISMVGISGDNITELVKSTQITRFIIDDETVYYIKEWTTDEIAEIVDYIANNEDERFTYLFALLRCGDIYSVNIKDRVSKKAQYDQSTVFSLYSSPQGTFCQISGLVKKFEKISFR